MTNVIIGIIGIVLASAAALITMDYGGDYFVEAHHRNNAAILETAGQNVHSAYQLFQLRYNSDPADLSALVSTTGNTRLLTAVPNVTNLGTVQNAWTSYSISSVNYPMFVITGVPNGVCSALNLRINGFANPEVIPGAAGPTNYREGCYNPGTGNRYYRFMRRP